MKLKMTLERDYVFLSKDAPCLEKINSCCVKI